MAITPTASKPRTLVNLLGIPGILTVIWLGGWWFFLFVWVVVLLGSVELKKLVQFQGGTPIMGMLFLSITAVVINYKLDMNYFEIIILVTGITTFSIEIFRNQKRPLLNISTVIMGSIWLGAMLGSLIILREQPRYGLELILLLFLSVWACDSAAFLFGKLFGKKKILPSVSPKKSWVGSISGLLAAVVVSYLLYAFAPSVFGYVDFGLLNGIFSLIDILILGIIFGGFSQLGDFAESLLKREAGLKDTSNFLQGHGGILDRFDSLSIAAPLTYVYLLCVV